MEKEKIRKCAYCRVSSKSDEQEHSLLFQTDYWRRQIESDPNAMFCGIYAEQKSGKNTRCRKVLLEMLRAAKRGEVDYIVTKSISRFSRSLVETALPLVHNNNKANSV